jgi:hypothetical protein
MGKRKIEIPEDVLSEMIRLYNEEYIGTPSLSDKFGYHKSIILRSFKDKGVLLGPSGRKWTGGKEVADKKWRGKNKEKLSEYYKEWTQQNKEHRKEYHKEWREKNKEYYQKYRRDYEKTKKDSDPSYRLACYTRTAVYTCLKERDVTKYKSTFDLLPYSLEELITHLESQFKEDMTWDNYGEWHVDHIKPMTSFNIQSPEDKSFQECWSLNNLQPLWGVENLSKGSRYLLI